MQMKRGSILAETVLVMPLLLLLIFGVIQFALIWTAKQMTAYAAFCATRAIMVVPDQPYSEAREIGNETEKDYAAQRAAQLALSWMCLAYDSEHDDEGVSIPGWGKVSKPDALRDPNNEHWRIRTRILARGESESERYVAVEVTFRYPLLIPGMAVNRIVGNSENLTADDMKVDMSKGTPNFYDHWQKAIGNPTLIDGWPYITLTETCVLPMPYSTANFPTGGFDGTDIRGGGS